MSIENSGGTGEEQRLSLEEAQNEANMIRAKAGVSPETGTIPTRLKGGDVQHEHEPTTAEYEETFQAIQSLKEIVRQDETGEVIKTLVKVSKIITIPTLAALFSQRVTRGVGSAVSGQGFEKGFNSSKDEWETALDFVYSDAQSQLKRLQKKGEKFGNEQAENVTVKE